MKRQGITPKLRFEIFKRDSFKCQYCGSSAPDVLLEIDHIKPVAKGGENDLLNLITSCKNCNRGKGRNKISDQAEIKKQQRLLQELNEKRNQLKLMIEWKKELSELENESALYAESFLNQIGIELTDEGKINLKKLITKYSLQNVVDAINISIDKYFTDSISIQKVLNNIPKIAACKEKEKTDLFFKDKLYLRKILINKSINFDNRRYFLLTDIIIDKDGNLNKVINFAKYTDSEYQIDNYINENYGYRL